MTANPAFDKALAEQVAALEGDAADPDEQASRDRLNAAFAKNFERQGIKNPGPRRVTDTNVLGDPIEKLNVDDIDVGWYVSHATLRYEAGSEYDPKTDAPIGTPKGGCVVDMYDDPERGRMVTVVEDRMVDRRLLVRRFTWPINELDPERCHPVKSIGRHGAAKKMLAAAARNTKFWSFDEDDFLVAAALNLTEPERRALATRPASSRCGEGHCVDVGGSCFESKDHLGVCCFCGALRRVYGTPDMTTYVMPFHVVDPVDRAASRCREPRCSRAVGHPGPHRSVNFDGTPTDTYWWSP